MDEYICDICLTQTEKNNLYKSKTNQKQILLSLCKTCFEWNEKNTILKQKYNKDKCILQCNDVEYDPIEFYNDYNFVLEEENKFDDITVNMEDEHFNLQTLNYLSSHKSILQIMNSCKSKQNTLYINLAKNRQIQFDHSIQLIEYVAPCIDQIYLGIKCEITQEFMDSLVELTKFKAFDYRISYGENKTVAECYTNLLIKIMNCSYNKKPKIKLSLDIDQYLLHIWLQNKKLFNMFLSSLSVTNSICSINLCIDISHNLGDALDHILSRIGQNTNIVSVSITFSEFMYKSCWNFLLQLLEDKLLHIKSFGFSLYDVDITNVMIQNLCLILKQCKELSTFALDIECERYLQNYMLEKQNMLEICNVLNNMKHIENFTLGGNNNKIHEIDHSIMNACITNIGNIECVNNLRMCMFDRENIENIIKYIELRKNGIIENVTFYVKHLNKFDGLRIINAFFNYLLFVSSTYFSIDILFSNILPDTITYIIKEYLTMNGIIVYVAENERMKTFFHDDRTNEIEMYKQYLKLKLYQFIKGFMRIKNNKSIVLKDTDIQLSSKIEDKRLKDVTKIFEQLLYGYKYCIYHIFKTIPTIYIEGVCMMTLSE